MNKTKYLDRWDRLKKHRSSSVLKDTYFQIEKVQLFTVASSLAYTTILSIIPVLAVSFAVFQTFGGMNKVYDTIEPLILSNLAEGAGTEVVETLRGLIKNTHAEVVGLGGFVGLIFTTMSMLYSSEKAINHIWNTKIQRSVFDRIASYWLFVTLGPLALSVAVGIATSLNFPLWKLFPSGTGFFLILVGMLFSTYKFVPATRVHWAAALSSSMITATLWSFARMGYTYYTQNIVSYNKVYGSLGAIPILLLWIYILWVITLSGAALTLAIQKNYQIQP